jgi:hypothetical protein
MKNIKKFVALILTASVGFSVTSVASAGEVDRVDQVSKQSEYSSIKEYGEAFLSSCNKDIAPNDPIELYDADNTVAALFFPLKDKGYIIINVKDYNVTEFSTESNNQYITDHNKKYFYNGPMGYMEEVNGIIVDSKTGDTIGSLSDLKLELGDANVYDESNMEIMNKLNTKEDNLSAVRSVKAKAKKPTLLKGTVPNYESEHYEINRKGICGSVASAMLLRYYDLYVNDNYVPYSLESASGEGLVNFLIPYIQGEGEGSMPGDVQAGLESYVRDRGITQYFTIETAVMGLIMNSVASEKPYILGLWNHPKYKSHWVTGYGYYQDSSSAFAVVNDGWGNRNTQINMSYADYIIY